MQVDPISGSDVVAEGNPAHIFAAALVDELARAGLEHVCICPGSRSTALAIVAASHPALRCWSQIDERSAAFFALGLAKATRRPAALICTSGTAAANFYPAVIEANYGHVPLIVLTADRPPELREWGAGQTIDQIHLYGNHVRWFAETAVPEADPQMLRYARELGCRAAAEAAGPPAGPVHLNLPFRDPLGPVRVRVDVSVKAGNADVARSRGRVYTDVRRFARAPKPDEVERLAQIALRCARGAISCGPMDAESDLCDGLAKLATRLGWPVLADPTSQLRSGAHTDGAPIFARSDLFLRDERIAEALHPEVVLRFGGSPTSKSFRLWLERQPPEDLILVDPTGSWNDPSHLASELLQVDPLALCDALNQRLSNRAIAREGWLEEFVRAEQRVDDVLEDTVATEEEMLEPRAVRELAAALPDGAILYVSNSMPVRDLDAFLPVSSESLRILANRGANGIDGMIASALGAAAAQRQPVVLMTGDLAFVHDVGALLIARRHEVNLTIVVFDNDGGGIFSLLPIADQADPNIFETHFRTPHGADLEALARAFGAAFARVTSWEHFRAEIKNALGSSGVSVVEIPIDRDRSVAHRREIERRVCEEFGRVGEQS
jgi:2-succinyl-5-enolpyruvyl-6-hydroxy-3-cyclohexene-1-carboxylate synthase